MRLTCPYCGARDQREFTVKGGAEYMDRPEGTEWSEGWQNYLHLRENVAGVSKEVWQHSGGCGAWLVVTRNTVTHEILDVVPAREAAQ